jgi:hypothetical protein
MVNMPLHISDKTNIGNEANSSTLQLNESTQNSIGFRYKI